MSFESSRSLEKVDQEASRTAAESDFSLFNSTMQPDGIFGTRPSSPWATDTTKPTSPFQNVENRQTSPFSTNPGGGVWRANFEPTSGPFQPRLEPHPNPWGPVTPTEPQRPAPMPNPRNDAPAPPRPVPVPRPQEPSGPWDKAPGAPWSKPKPSDSSTSGGPWDKGPWSPGGDGGAGRPGGGTGDAGQLKQAFQRDQASRTSYSFDEAVQIGKQLGKQSETALELEMRDWLSKQNGMNPIVHMRGTALLADSLGQFRLEEGSRIDLTSHQDTKPRILKGYDYDFGGEANTWLRLSAGSLVAAQQYVMGHKGLTIEGQPMDDAYLAQLKKLQTDVESKLNVIYGPHDIESIYAVIKDQVRVKSGDWQQGLVRLQHQLDALQSKDSRFVAKSARDVALGYLAEADYMASKDNGEDANIMYQAANKYLSMSQRLDGSAPDNMALAQISQRLAPQIEKARDNQWKDPFGNPFEIPRPNTLIA